MSYIFQLILLGLMTSVVQADDCPYQGCECTGNQIVCGYENFKVMPQLLFKNSSILRSLILDQNQITTIPAGSLPANLSSISIEGNPIETIADTAFDDSIYTLQELYFSEAHFTQIPEAVFHLKALKILHIYQTNILVWNEEGMTHLGSKLETFSLIDVGMTSWPNWMKSMTNVTNLIINQCSISSIPDDAFDEIGNNLTSLDLSNNDLTTLPKSMSTLTALSTLTLSNNRITDVTWLPQSSQLTTLYLDNNKITDAEKLSYVLKPCAHILITLAIQNNSLTSIPELSFLTQILYLNFRYNHLTDTISGSFPANMVELDFEYNLFSSIPSSINNLIHLTDVYLNSNNIQFLQGTQIPTSVELLYIDFNSISQLNRNSFPNNSSLSYLTLNNNPLSTISPDAFTNIPFLAQLSLQNTKLTRLPLALTSLTKLKYLNLSKSKTLVCTCQEQNLQSMIVSLGMFGAVGDCGMTSIYLFFATLSPECPMVS